MKLINADELKTREELIRNLKYTMKKHENDTVSTFGTNISLMCKDVLNYLEQEPCNDVLDKIRAEIESQRKEILYMHGFGDKGSLNYYCFGLNDGFKDARDIIDKYKAEGEVEK